MLMSDEDAIFVRQHAEEQRFQEDFSHHKADDYLLDLIQDWPEVFGYAPWFDAWHEAQEAAWRSRPVQEVA